MTYILQLKIVHVHHMSCAWVSKPLCEVICPYLFCNNSNGNVKIIWLCCCSAFPTCFHPLRFEGTVHFDSLKWWTVYFFSLLTYMRTVFSHLQPSSAVKDGARWGRPVWGSTPARRVTTMPNTTARTWMETLPRSPPLNKWILFLRN